MNLYIILLNYFFIILQLKTTTETKTTTPANNFKDQLAILLKNEVIKNLFLKFY